MYPGVHGTRLYRNGEEVEPVEIEILHGTVTGSFDSVTEVFEEKLREATVNKTTYWQQKSGRLRKMGKSKARPGETMVYLTDEEAHAFGFNHVPAN